MSEERQGFNAPEPDPPKKSDEPAVWDLVLTQYGDLMSDGIKKDIMDRDRAGELKYGTRLRLNNGRNALVDLYQELLDATVYAAQYTFENEPMGPAGGFTVAKALGMVARLLTEADNVRKLIVAQAGLEHDFNNSNPASCKRCGQWDDGRPRDFKCPGK